MSEENKPTLRIGCGGCLTSIVAIFLIFIFLFRGCESCSKNYHNTYGVKGWGEFIIFGDKYMKEKYSEEVGKDE